jgi:Tfp pilus assembly PilM family ATPase
MISALLPSGLPAPYSLELSGLASITTFMHGPGKQHTGEAVGVIDFGANTTVFVLLNKNVVALIRRFDMGTNAILEKVQKSLGIDRETAQGIIADGAFDISQAVGEVMEPLVKQLVVSRDFVERRENCHVGKIYVSGGLIVSRDSLDEMTSAMGVEIAFWNPFDGLEVAPDAIPDNLSGQEWRFSAAIGAGLATFEG